jgi:hypothetical protein
MEVASSNIKDSYLQANNNIQRIGPLNVLTARRVPTIHGLNDVIPM